MTAGGPLSSRDLLILDGATGTELERRGVDIGLPLWSANAIEHAPDTLHDVHVAYLRAGADLLTANTFRTNARALHKAGRTDEDAAALTRRAVEIARSARDAVNAHALVLGSVAPLEDCYQPERSPDEATSRQEHGRMIETLVDAGVDGILIETMNALPETRGAVLAAASSGVPYVVSFCLRSDGAPGTLLSGEVFDDLSRLGDPAEAPMAIGVNCVGAPQTRAHVQHLRALAPASMRVMAYGNIGYAADDGNWVCTDAIEPDRYAAYARDWLASGATILGGCCGTTPAMVERIRALRG